MSQRRPRPATKNSPRKTRKPLLPKEISETVLTVERLGAQGDGQASHAGRTWYLSGALPGETVRARPVEPRGDGIGAETLAVLTAAPERVAPPCPHFGPCGGCTLQHLSAPAALAWKRDTVVEALGRRDLTPTVTETAAVPPGRRRRAVLAAVGTAEGAVLGFHARRGATVVDLTACPLIHPALESLIAPLRALLADVLRSGVKVQAAATLTDGGIDLLVDGGPPPDLAARIRLAAFAEDRDLARFTWSPLGGAPEPLAERRPPILDIAGVAVKPPPGGFVQPSAEGQALIAERVEDALAGVTGPVADLHAGIGTLTFPRAKRSAVHAVEGDAAALEALLSAANAHQLPGVTAEHRDLARDPLEPETLDRFAAVVFDPPRGGAKAQAERLAEASVPVVVGVSCNPATFARDARILEDGGYRLTWVAPIDQFPWSGHVELVGRFLRD